MHSMYENENENIPLYGKRIDYFRIPHNTLCLPPKYCIFQLLSSKMQYSQDHLKKMVYATIWGQTECIIGDSSLCSKRFRATQAKGIRK